MKSRGLDPESDLRIIFEGFDADNNGLLTLTEWISGIKGLVPDLSPLLLEKLFAAMDLTNIGYVNLKQFESLLSAKAPFQLPRRQGKTDADGFKWQDVTIKQIKKLARNKGLDAEEAFKLFDMDFDGKVSAADLKNALLVYLKMPMQ